jgi:hypothetical protein
MFHIDRESYWEAYREAIALPVEPFRAIVLPGLFAAYEPLHWQCVYCREEFATLDLMQAHYDERKVGDNLTLIPRSRRGYTAESWERSQKKFNAPTIRAITKD